MSKYKVGKWVRSLQTSAGCAPDGMKCEIIRVWPGYSKTGIALYEVRTLDGRYYRNFEDELIREEKNEQI